MTQATVTRTIPGTDLSVFPLSLGGNVFGWTADEDSSFEILDAYVAGGGNFIDTADVYSLWAPGNSGGESETIIGKWLAARGHRADVVIATKVSSHPDAKGLSRESIRKGVEASLRRLGTDYIDLYYAHRDDESVEIAETIGAFAELVAEGKVRALAASNFTAERLTESLRVADELSAPRYVAVQPHYNLVHRDEFEGALQEVVDRENLVTVPYSALASGFLTGKYRTGAADGRSPRGEGAARYLDGRGRKVLAALDQIAAERGAAVTSVALAWLAAQPTVIAPIASASKLAQVESLIASAHLNLSTAQLDALTAASA
ncbi:Predicted oxidoreductase [Nakamurella panacisegetis]|uniref:Predicted oxidoreductase n=1 Tax=Nakamurella panacisegetis TaxID=1090615 RepID=A0A1H0KDR9_9ACTN|nr:aldo/keto reductase [Nakamurella panacisegetis]SDO54104.1 Predicted oxidoreductase [Nakamurella panacisegetis]